MAFRLQNCLLNPINPVPLFYAVNTFLEGVHIIHHTLKFIHDTKKFKNLCLRVIK